MKPEALKRGEPFYSEAAVRLIDSIYNDRREDPVRRYAQSRGARRLAGRRRGRSLPARSRPKGLCRSRSAGCDRRFSASLQIIKAFEALTVRAGVYDRGAASSLTMNPLVPSFNAAQSILKDILKENAEYLPVSKLTCRARSNNESLHFLVRSRARLCACLQCHPKTTRETRRNETLYRGLQWGEPTSFNPLLPRRRAEQRPDVQSALRASSVQSRHRHLSRFSPSRTR